MKRRIFLQRTLLSSGLLALGGFPFSAFASGELIKLTILHTNDTHSRIEPFPADSKFPNLGGIARRAALVKNIRQQEQHVLLFDSGDIFQGTPYFNYFRGSVEMELMSKVGYDAATIGNHDFDAGVEGLAKQMPLATFPMIATNYDFRDTPMEGKTRPFAVFQKGSVIIGVIGLGIELEGLVPPKLYGNTRYLEPVKSANKTARMLKKEYGCDLVLCLSHLGYKYGTPKISDIVLAQNTEHIDLILGGHTHTFLQQPDVIRNRKNQPVLVNQVGWGGVVVGRIDIVFDYTKKSKKIFSEPVKVS
ncbi:MAG: metallophosphatase [Chitinophagales bacterium]|nr:MAG: metallophosphatase [Chitinophagales bacterium]